jgi:hypothetical protein
MLKVDRQSGGFTPHAPLNRVPSGCSTGVESVTIPLGPTPLNETRPKSYLSPGITIIPLWQNSYNLICTIPLGFTPPAPLNRVQPVKSTPVISKRISQGCLQGVQLGWNLYPTCNLNKNGHIEVESFNLLNPDGSIPLGLDP